MRSIAASPTTSAWRLSFLGAGAALSLLAPGPLPAQIGDPLPGATATAPAPPLPRSPATTSAPPLPRSPATFAPHLTLPGAIAAALATHPSLAAARARTTEAEGGVDAARSAFRPALAINGSATYFQEPMIVAPLHGLDLQNPPTFDRALIRGTSGVRYTLWDGGERGDRLEAARAGLRGAEAGRDAVRMDLIRDVAGLYLAVGTARAVQDAAERHTRALESEEGRAARMVQEGAAAEVEVMQARAALAEGRADGSAAAARRTLAEERLARAMGVPPAAVRDAMLTPAGPAPGSPATPGSPAPPGSPELAAARGRLAAAEALAAAEESARGPSFDVGAGVQTFASGSGDFINEWQTGVEVTWPLFTGGARSAAVRRARAAADAAAADLELAALRREDALDQADAAVTEAHARVEALEAATTAWQEVARIRALALSEGSGVQSDLLEAEASLFRSRAALASARADVAFAVISRARAEGTLTPDWLATSMEAAR